VLVLTDKRLGKGTDVKCGDRDQICRSFHHAPARSESATN
jgi:hypothetical protein